MAVQRSKELDSLRFGEVVFFVIEASNVTSGTSLKKCTCRGKPQLGRARRAVQFTSALAACDENAEVKSRN